MVIAKEAKMLQAGHIETVDSIVNRVYGTIPEHTYGDTDDHVVFVVCGIADHPELRKKFDEYVAMAIPAWASDYIKLEFE
jgi:hypothetical protein